MTEAARIETTPLAKALGKVPSGLSILTIRHEGRTTGMLVSWVQQAGFNPPSVTVALGSGRFVTEWVAASGRFTLNQIAAGSKSLVRHFGQGFPPDADAFQGLTLRDDIRETGGPVLADALAYLDLEVTGSVDSGDHRVFLAKVIAGEVLDAKAEPLTHVRGSGLHY